MRSAYVTTAVLAFNSVVAILAINLVLAGVYAIVDTRRPMVHPVLRDYPRELVRRAYPELSEQQMLDLLAESWGRPLAFEPFTQFKEGAIRGRYVNVTAAGFRGNGADATPPWPPDPDRVNVFMFGGSTTFGYGLPDDQTIAAHFGNAFPGSPAVYNFGRGNYFSTQERVLFEQLLVNGHAPDVAIFIDGVNEFLNPDGKPSGSERLERVYTIPSVPGQAVDLAMRTPLGRFVRSIQNRLPDSGERPARRGGRPSLADSAALERIVSRYLQNKSIIQAVAATRGIRTAFIWQPAPNYKYDDTAYHLFKGSSYGSYSGIARGYALIRERLTRMPRDPRLLWLADIQEHLAEPLYVDRIHYDAKFSRMLAEAIAGFLQSQDGAAPAP
jgi:hypothetical protein